MAYTTINKSTDYFNTKLYTGNSTDNRSITGLDFQPDWVWIKERGATNAHYIFDAVRGADKQLASNSDAAEYDYSGDANRSLKSFTSDGFTLGTGGGVNNNSDTYVAWNWKAGTTSGIDATGATITPTAYSFNQAAGFSIIKYTGTGSSQSKVAHGLGSIPAMVIIKKINASGDSWGVKHQDYTTNSYYQYLNSNIAQTNAADNFYNAAPTDKFFYIETDGPTNTSGATYIAYCFSEKVGYSKFGSYVGNSSTDGSFIFTGFAPAFLIFKRTNATNDWFMIDNKRPGSNEIDMKLKPNATAAEEHNNYNNLDFYSNGFKFRTADGDSNVGEFIYMAFGQSLVGSNNVPCTAR